MPADILFLWCHLSSWVSVIVKYDYQYNIVRVLAHARRIKSLFVKRKLKRVRNGPANNVGQMSRSHVQNLCYHHKKNYHTEYTYKKYMKASSLTIWKSWEMFKFFKSMSKVICSKLMTTTERACHKEHMQNMSLTVKKNLGQRSKSRLHLPLQRL